jgi:hypothetical protein
MAGLYLLETAPCQSDEVTLTLNLVNVLLITKAFLEITCIVFNGGMRLNYFMATCQPHRPSKGNTAELFETDQGAKDCQGS